MNPADAFLQEILAHPDDDAPRLVYADWLEEQGDVRAEFLRIQCALFGMEEYHRDYPRLRKRELELLGKYKTAWLGPIQGLTFEAKFYRGLVREITVGPRQFVQNHRELFRLAPIQRVNLTGLTRLTAAEFAGCENLARVSELRLAGGGMCGVATEDLFRSPYWANLRKLTWRGDQHPAARTLLVDALDRLSLEEFSLAGVFLGASGAFLFTQVRGASSLRRLDLSSSGIGAAGAQRLAASRWLAQLRQLDLSYNAIGDEGLRALVQSPMMQTLESLDLSHNALRDYGLRRFLAALAVPPRIVSLSLAQNDLPDDSAEVLSQAASLRRLKHLNLSHVGNLDPPGIRQMAEVFSLTTLRLYHCRIGDEGAIQLAKAANSTSLRLLDLNDNRLTDAAAEAILDSPHLANLTRLDLRNNAIGRDRQRALRRRFGPGVCTFSR